MPVQALTEEEYAGHLNWQLWRDMLRFARPYRPYLAILMGIAAVTAGCEAGFNLATRVPKGNGASPRSLRKQAGLVIAPEML